MCRLIFSSAFSPVASSWVIPLSVVICSDPSLPAPLRPPRSDSDPDPEELPDPPPPDEDELPELDPEPLPPLEEPEPPPSPDPEPPSSLKGEVWSPGGGDDFWPLGEDDPFFLGFFGFVGGALPVSEYSRGENAIPLRAPGFSMMTGGVIPGGMYGV